MTQSNLNDDQVLALGTAIQQLRSAEADVARKAGELDAVTRNRDATKARVEKLRGQQPAAAPAAADAKPAANAVR